MKVTLSTLFLQIAFFTPAVSAIQFSADAVMSTPGGADVSTHLYYSSGRIRKEFFYYGEPVIQILDGNKHISLMCFTEQQVCYENKALEEINIGIESAMESPCVATKTLKCENLGEQELNKRQAIQWKIISKEGNKELVSHLWLDAELKIPVKQMLFNGTSIELEWQGSEKLDSRDTEKWVQRIKLSNGEVQESVQWFDKELKISIRESYSNGNSKELKHIVVENIPDKLFTIPVGYEKKTMKMDKNQASNNKPTIQ
jgi:hypothetical protein